MSEMTDDESCCSQILELSDRINNYVESKPKELDGLIMVDVLNISHLISLGIAVFYFEREMSYIEFRDKLKGISDKYTNFWPLIAKGQLEKVELIKETNKHYVATPKLIELVENLEREEVNLERD